MKIIPYFCPIKNTLNRIALAATVSTASLSAGVILSEDFETLNDDAQLFGGLNTFQSSEQANGGADWLTGQDYGSGAPGTGYNGEGGSTAIYFDKSAGSSNLRLRQKFDLSATYDATLAHTVTFDFYSDSGTTQTGDFRLFMDDGSGSLENALDLNFFSALGQVRPSTGPFSYGSGFTVAGGGTQLKKDTWYRYVLTINPLNTATDTFDLTVAESGVGTVISATGIAFDTDISDIDRMEFQMFNAGVTAGAYFDNISISAIPEPGVMAPFLGLLTLVLAFHRPRRR